jgi:hypothetical protein
MLSSEVPFRPGKNNKTMQTLNRLARCIREEGPLDHGVLAVKAGMAPSTLYSYQSALLHIFQDLRYDRGTYSSLQEKPKAQAAPEEKEGS